MSISKSKTYTNDEHVDGNDDTIHDERGNTMLLIGITGKAGAGKDSVGIVLRSQYEFTILSFAQPIKDAISVMLGTDPELWNDRVWKETPIPYAGNHTPRYLAQTLGTEWGRDCVARNLWVDLTMRRVKTNYCMGTELIAITDVRFENEADVIRSRGIIIHIHRGVTEYIDNITHASEAGIIPMPGDYHIYNNGPLVHIEHEVIAVMETIFRQRKSA